MTLGVRSRLSASRRSSPRPHSSPLLERLAEAFLDKMEDAELKLIRAVRREVKRAASRARGDLPWTAPSSVSSGTSGDDGELTPEFIAAAEAVNRALARAVAEEVEDQLTDVLMCLGEETTKVEVLSYALARGFGVEVPELLREAGYSPDASPPGSRDESPTGEPHPNAISTVPRDGRRPAASRYANLLPPSARRDEGVTRIGNRARGSNAGRRVGGASFRRRRGRRPENVGDVGDGCRLLDSRGSPLRGSPLRGSPRRGSPRAEPRETRGCAVGDDVRLRVREGRFRLRRLRRLRRLTTRKRTIASTVRRRGVSVAQTRSRRERASSTPRRRRRRRARVRRAGRRARVP